MMSETSTGSMRKIQKKITKLGTAKTLSKRVKLNEKIKKMIKEEENVLKDHLKKLQSLQDAPNVGGSQDNEKSDNEKSDNDNKSGSGSDSESDEEPIDVYKITKEIHSLTRKIDECDDIEGRIDYLEELKRKKEKCQKHYKSMEIQIKNLN